MDKLEELRAAILKTKNAKLLELLLRAESKLGNGVVRERRTIHGTTLDVLSPHNYWRSDGSMRCPFEEFLGHVACDYHSYSGCSNDPDDASETMRLLLQAEKDRAHDVWEGEPLRESDQGLLFDE
jgi:hypothetical protein